MGGLQKVAENDITKFKEKMNKNDDIPSSEIKKRLLENLETNQLIAMLKATQEKDGNPLQVLNDMGFSLKDLTSGMKESLESYKGMAETERMIRGEIESREHEAREENYKLRERLIENQVSQLIESSNKTVQELIKKIENSKEKKNDDPVNEIGTGLVKRLLEEKIQDLTEQKQYDPMAQLFNSLETYEMLKEKFKTEKKEIPDDPRKIDLELLKLKMEDERETKLAERRIALDREKHETVKYAFNTFGAELADAIGAIATVLSQQKQNTQNVQQPAQSQPQQNKGVQGIPYQCEDCGEIFVLNKMVENATCPYCGQGGEVTNSTEQNKENAG